MSSATEKYCHVLCNTVKSQLNTGENITSGKSTHFPVKSCCNVCKMDQLEDTTGKRRVRKQKLLDLICTASSVFNEADASSHGCSLRSKRLGCNSDNTVLVWISWKNEKPVRIVHWDPSSRTPKQPGGWERGRQPSPAALRGDPEVSGQRLKSSPLEVID